MLSHRDSTFVSAYQDVRGRLSVLANGMATAILTGSGTTANDSVAMHLNAAFGRCPGLILVNGEFGGRLVTQARNAGLQFKKLEWDWGQAWDPELIASALDSTVGWIWAVHLETSTGVLNPLHSLLRLTGGSGPCVAADCISSLGAVRIPEGLWMASAVSGKSTCFLRGTCVRFCVRRSTGANERQALSLIDGCWRGSSVSRPTIHGSLSATDGTSCSACPV